MDTRYPLSIRNDRILPPDYGGPAYVWDVDKTYLATHFSSWRGLLRIPLEFAVDKVAIPGMPEVLRGLRRGAGEGVACHPIFFISASPPFLRGAIEGKMLEDGVEYDGITFKDWVGAILRLTPGRILDQLGFKTAALLRGRADRPGATEFLFGDDYERDAQAFSLYARWINGEADAAELETSLNGGGVAREDVRIILDMAEQVPRVRGRVEKIFIHLEKRTPPEAFAGLAPYLLPVRGAYQMALALRETGAVDELTVDAVRQVLFAQKGFRHSEFLELEEDAQKRGIIRRKKAPPSVSGRKGTERGKIRKKVRAARKK